MNQLLLATAGQVVVTFFLVMTSLLLIGLILLQKNRGSGLSGAFGGVGGHTAFGTKTGDFLTWVTVGLAAFFLLLSVIANFVFDRGAVTAQAAPPPAAPAPIDLEPVAAPVQNSPQVQIITPEQLNSGSIPLNVPVSPAGGNATPPATPPAAATPAPAPTTQPGS